MTGDNAVSVKQLTRGARLILLVVEGTIEKRVCVVVVCL